MHILTINRLNQPITGQSVTETQICQMLGAGTIDVDVLERTETQICGWAYFDVGEGFDAFAMSIDGDGIARYVWGCGHVTDPIAWNKY